MPGYIVNLQEKEALQNVTFSPHIFHQENLYEDQSWVPQYYSIPDKYCVKHDTLINPMDPRNHGESMSIYLSK